VTLFTAMAAMKKNLAALKRENALGAAAASLLPLKEYYELTGLDALLAREKQYQEAAQSLLKKPTRKQSA
jgi:hypothetical protein